jgi:hypothetical protein
MFPSLSDLLIRPERFFAARAAEAPDFRIPAIIVLCGAAISAAAAFMMSDLYAQMFAGAAIGGMGTFLGAISAVSAFVGFIIIWWLVMAGVFFLISMVFDGKGAFQRTLVNVGYGLLPLVIGSVFTLALTLYYMPRVVVPSVRNLQDPSAIQQAILGLMHDPAMREFTQISGIITIIFLIWAANIWIFGVRQARELTLRNAAITVLIPVVISIAYTVFTLVFGVPVPGGT